MATGVQDQLASILCSFFFQAEDGIRDVAVTGVQTCALPISSRQSAGTVAVSKRDSVREAEPAQLEKRQDELLEKSDLLELASEAILVLDAERRVIFWNQGAERLYGWTRSEVLGKSPETLLQTQSSLPTQEIEKRISGQGWWGGEL